MNDLSVDTRRLQLLLMPHLAWSAYAAERRRARRKTCFVVRVP